MASREPGNRKTESPKHSSASEIKENNLKSNFIEIIESLIE